jgi:hypothetical protein
MADRGITRHIRHMDTRIPARVPVLPMPDHALVDDLAAVTAEDVPVVVTAAGITVTDNPL